MDLQLWLDTLDLVPWSLLIKLSIIGIIALIVKKHYDNISSYFMFRANRDLGKNVKVIVNGDAGYITYFTWKFIYVKLIESGNELVIPITKWTTYKWEICRNGFKKEKN